MLRWYLLALLVTGAWLDLGVGLRVFSPPSFGVVLVGPCLAWLPLSILAERRATLGLGQRGSSAVRALAVAERPLVTSGCRDP